MKGRSIGTGRSATAVRGDDGVAFVEGLRARLLDALRADLAGLPDRWVVFDFPSQLNCGDSAIWLGERAAAAALGARLVRAVDRRNAADVRVPEDRLLLLHGGGNFGGLYATHEDLRLGVLRRWRGRRVVQLPQSVEWASPAARSAMQRAVGEHGAFLLYVRDERSYARAIADLDCEVRLVPDAAFALGPLPRPFAGRGGVVVQRRTDKEAAGGGDGLPAFDWLEAPPSSRRALLLRSAQRGFDLSRRLGGRDVRIETALAHALAGANLRFAQQRLSEGAAVVTDRLHGHVISTLMGVPHCVVDDANGKIRALWDTWTHAAPTASFAAHWVEGERWIRERRGA